MSGSELTPEARALLDAARREISPTKADRDRVRKAIAVAAGGAAVVAAGTTLASTGGGAGAGAGAGAAGAGAGAGTLGGISLAVKVGIAITIVTVAATGTTVALKVTAPPSAQEVAAQHVARHAHHGAATAEHGAAQPQQRVDAPASAPEAAQLAVPSAAQVAPSPGAPSLPVAPPHARGAATDRDVGLAPPPPGVTMPEPEEVGATFDQEQALIRQAKAAVERHDAITADARLEELATLNPHSQFREEAAVLGILIMCESHDVDRARAAAERFRAQYPESSAAHRLRGSCVDP